jgi:acetoacetyl-CoA synthetase
MGHFLSWVQEREGRRFDGYHDLWRWSVDDLAGFWSAVWEYFAVTPVTQPTEVLADRSMPGTEWFPGATLNYAAHALRHSTDDAPAVLSYSQTREPVVLSWAQLRDQVARARAGLARLGVSRGDVVAGYVPNISEAIVAFLATASLGAIWTSCAPEFGVGSVVDRLAQVEPKVLITVDGYRHGARVIRRDAEVAAFREALPGLAATVMIPYLDPGHLPPPRTWSWSDLLGETGPLSFEAVPFDHPLYVLYSSGTTGLPKPIVHGHGGILLEHLKALGLHADLGPGDRFFWFTTTGWMMWNLLVSGLLVGAAVVAFDGDPGHPDLGALWRLAEETGTTYFGVSAPFLLSCRKAELHPAKEADLSLVRAVGSTGAPLPPEGFDWVAEELGPDVQLASISGGTDVCTAFVGMTPLLPVHRGEISAAYLGCEVESFDPDGCPVRAEQGELVVTTPMPSMPVGFWGDDDGSRYRAAYFTDFPGVWRHGDWVTITDHGGYVISGRSDATLNRGGVRSGTSEYYSVVESFPEVADSLVIHLEDPDGGVGTLVLLLALGDGGVLDDDLRSRIAGALRRSLSPRHVPDHMLQIPAVPRTLSGKKLEVPVKRILTGTPIPVAAASGALANPAALEAIAALAPTIREAPCP